jgi:glycerol-3-phosphate dehydrogenase
MWRNERGVSYPGVLLVTLLLPLLFLGLAAGLTHGMRLAGQAAAKTEILSAAQEEMERVRGIQFAQLQSYTVNGADGVGNVTVEDISSRQKRFSVALRHPGSAEQAVVLVTYVHQNGLSR